MSGRTLFRFERRVLEAVAGSGVLNGFDVQRDWRSPIKAVWQLGESDAAFARKH
jgi:hypothetical protein